MIPSRPEGPLKPLEPGLYVVSTPIGNLADLTFRALDVLTRCDCVLAEDTRVAAKLLGAYGVKNRVERYDDHADVARTLSICARLEAGDRIALISDAGTPLVSDPGFRLVRAAVERDLRVIPVPGASAVLAALSISGLPTDRFLFAGFTPPKSQARRSFLTELAEQRCTLVFYETGPRLRASLEDMALILGPRPAAVSRELTKLFETCVRGSLAELSKDSRLDGPKGEIVVVVGAPQGEAAGAGDVDRALVEALSRLSPSAAAAEVARALNAPKRVLYARALELKGRAPHGGV